MDTLVLLHHEQSSATVLAFRPRPLEARALPPPVDKDRPETKYVSGGVEATNRPAIVFREIMWAIAIPIGTVLLLRILFALFLVL